MGGISIHWVPHQWHYIAEPNHSQCGDFCHAVSGARGGGGAGRGGKWDAIRGELQLRGHRLCAHGWGRQCGVGWHGALRVAAKVDFFLMRCTEAFIVIDLFLFYFSTPPLRLQSRRPQPAPLGAHFERCRSPHFCSSKGPWRLIRARLST